jgi:4-cresol dehydrogenase (hydroxylating)
MEEQIQPANLPSRRFIMTMSNTTVEGQNASTDQEKTDFSQAIAMIRGVVGEAYVETGPEDLERHSRTIIPWERKCAAVVYPGSTEEIRRIVEIANRFGLRLWTFGQGKNWGYGTTTAVHDGAVVVLLQRMNRIIEVNEELAYALIEPGVTQRQLDDYLKQNKIKLWTDCTDGPSNGSVVGNALDRGVGETPYGDHFEKICGLEVVLPDGSLIRTGAAHFSKSKSWNVFKWGVGPYMEGMFSQSNYGIVTKMGIWLMPEPQCFNSYVFELRREEDLPVMIDKIRRLALQGAIQSKVHIINDFIGLALVGKYPHHLLAGESYLSDEIKAQLRKRYNIAPWSFGGGIYGSPAQVRAHRALIKKEFSPYGKLTFVSDRKMALLGRVVSFLRKARSTPRFSRLADRLSVSLMGKPFEYLEAFPHIHTLLQGVPSDYFIGHCYFKTRMEKPTSDIDPARDRCGLMWAGIVVPSTGKALTELLDVVKPLYRKHRFDFSTALMLANPRAIIALMSIFFEREDPEETGRAMALYNEMCETTAAAGYQQYRTTVAYMDRILRHSPSFRDMTDKIKQVLDPHNILAPGRYGIGFHENAAAR